MTVTVAPLATRSVAGENAKFWMVMAPDATGGAVVDVVVVVVVGFAVVVVAAGALVVVVVAALTVVVVVAAGALEVVVVTTAGAVVVVVVTAWAPATVDDVVVTSIVVSVVELLDPAVSVVPPPLLQAATRRSVASVPIVRTVGSTSRSRPEIARTVRRMDVGQEFGPLAALVGTWKGDQGLDVAYQHARGQIGETPYRERTTFSPFGPVDNGTQSLYGLDYRMAAWRGEEENPFHTEIGYWLWDAADGQVMRCFMVPRGSTILAGGPAAADSARFTMAADVGSEAYGILSNAYLAKEARTARYEVTVELDGDTYAYDSTTTIEHAKLSEPLLHTDRNTLRRIE